MVKLLTTVVAAIIAVVLSRFVLRSERAIADAAGVLPFVVGGVGVAMIARWSRGRVSILELAIAGCVASVCITTLAMPRAPFWAYALLPYLALAASVLLAQRFSDATAARWALAITGALVAASVLLDAFAGIGVSAARRPGGLLGNRNFAGEYLALALPAALVVLARSRRTLAILLLFGAALALTRCRTAWLAAACVLVAVPALSSSGARSRHALGAALVLAGALLATVLPSRLAWRDPFAATLARAVELDAGSGQLRVRQYEATLRVLVAHDAWLGLGAGSWQAAVAARDRAAAKNRIPHSDYLRVLADGGVPALGSLGIALLAAAITALRRRRRDAPDLVVFVGVLAVIALADAPLFRLEVIVITGAMLAALAPPLPARAISCGLAPAVPA